MRAFAGIDPKRGASRICLHLALACAGLHLAGCASFARQLPLARTPGEYNSNFGYIPLDGLAVQEWPDRITCAPWYTSGNFEPAAAYRPLLESFPDLSVRFAVASFQANAGLTFGPAQVTTRGSNYRAILDYVNVDAIPVEFWIRVQIRTPAGLVWRPVSHQLEPGERVVSYEARTITQRFGDPEDALFMPESEEERRSREELVNAQFQQVTIPVYVGIGMRLSADILALDGGITLSSLGAIGAQAQANTLTGTLTVQTLGINGRPVATALPLPSKLDQTTVENAILALGSSRTILFAGNQNNEVTTTARIVGLYSPIGSDPRLVNAIYSELSRQPPRWFRSCKPKVNPPASQPAGQQRPASGATPPRPAASSGG